MGSNNVSACENAENPLGSTGILIPGERYSLLDCYALWWYGSFADVKGIVHPKIQLLMSFTDLHVVSNTYDILSSL